MACGFNRDVFVLFKIYSSVVLAKEFPENSEIMIQQLLEYTLVKIKQKLMAAHCLSKNLSNLDHKIKQKM